MPSFAHGRGSGSSGSTSGSNIHDDRTFSTSSTDSSNGQSFNLTDLIFQPKHVKTPVGILVADRDCRMQRYAMMKGNMKPDHDLVKKHKHIVGFKE